MTMALETWRCSNCGRILAKLQLAPGSTVEVKCKCNALNSIAVGRPPQPVPMMATVGAPERSGQLLQP